MKFVYQKKFDKRFRKLSKKFQIKALNSLKKYEDGIHDKELNLHRLKGNYKNFWTINVTGDIRILLNPKTGEVVDILDIGNHNYFY